MFTKVWKDPPFSMERLTMFEQFSVAMLNSRRVIEVSDYHYFWNTPSIIHHNIINDAQIANFPLDPRFWLNHSISPSPWITNHHSSDITLRFIHTYPQYLSWYPHLTMVSWLNHVKSLCFLCLPMVLPEAMARNPQKNHSSYYKNSSLNYHEPLTNRNIRRILICSFSSY